MPETISYLYQYKLYFGLIFGYISYLYVSTIYRHRLCILDFLCSKSPLWATLTHRLNSVRLQQLYFK